MMISVLSGLRLFVPLIISLVILLIIEAVEATLPFEARSPSPTYYVIFLVYIIPQALLFLFFFQGKYWTGVSKEACLYADRLSNRLLILAATGVVFIIIDRVFIQGVSYADGVSTAREAWREGSTERAKIFSKLCVPGSFQS